jgi:hypothetical protein
MASALPELPEPGVEILQTFKKASPTIVRPTLVPCTVGPAFEVINVLNTDGTINSKARYGVYNQLGLNITESSFPDPRLNIDELDIIESSVAPYMFAGGSLSQLKMDPGQSFLAYGPVGVRAAVRSVNFVGATGLALNGLVITLAIDVPTALDTSHDVAIVFQGTGNLTSADACEQVNAALGFTAATVVGTAPYDHMQIASATHGALSSVTVRAGGSANAVLGLGFVSGSAAHEERVEGYGWRGQDQNNNTTQTPWIEFFDGAYLVDGEATALPTPTDTSKAVGFINDSGDETTFEVALHTDITFGSSGTIPLVVGDFFYADGIRLNSGEVMKIEAKRFKVGTVNPNLSTVDENGNYTTKVYDLTKVGTIYDANALAPHYSYFRANGLDWRKLAPTPATLVGGAVVDGGAVKAATKAVITGTTVHSASIAVAGLRLHTIVTIDGVETDGVFTFTGGPFADDPDLTVDGSLCAMDKLVAALNAAVAVPGVTFANTTPPTVVAPKTLPHQYGGLKLSTVKTGRLQNVIVKADGTVNATLSFSTTVDVDASLGANPGTDVTYVGITGTGLMFTISDNPHIFTAFFSSDSLDLAIDEINETAGVTVASKTGSGGSANAVLKLTSALAGIASKVTVIDQYDGVDAGTKGAEWLFKMLLSPSACVPNATYAAGAGRPMPDAYMDDASVLHIQSQILRDLVTGIPLDQTYNTGTLYIQFKALRRDVTAVAVVPGVLRISDVTTLGTVLDPLTEDNPLGLAMFLMLINAPTFECKGLGVDEITPAAPYGTGAAYARAAALLEAEEVYALAPLTQDEVIHELWVTHVDVMSGPEQGGERIVFINKLMPVQANPGIALSGTNAASTTNENEVHLDADPTAGLLALGIHGPALAEGLGVYLEVTVDGELRHYNLATVNGSLVTARTTFTNPLTDADGFYSTTDISTPIVDASYSLKVRGASLVIPGSNPPRLDYSLVANTVAIANGTIHDRRCYSVFPDTIKTTIAGIEKSLPGFYACAAIAGMVASKPPQQGFTNYPMTGFTGVVGTEKFTRSQLNIMAGGGTYILKQDAIGAPLTSRHQLSTNTDSIEMRELSITKVVDFTAKFLRMAVRKFIGVNVINDNLLDSLGTTIHAVLKFLEEAGVLNGSAVNNILQDSTNMDTVLIDVTLDVPYPCNYLRLTLVI